MRVLLTVCAVTLTFSTYASNDYDQLMAIQPDKTVIYEVQEKNNGEEKVKVIKRGSTKELNSLVSKGKSIGEPDKLPNRTLPTKPGVNPGGNAGKTPGPNGGGGKNIIATTRELIALGKEIYQIVEEGRPVVNIQSDALSILPRDEKGAAVDSFSLSEWREPLARTYRVETKNGISGTWFEGTPVAFDFMLLYTYGGRLDGKGYYISGAQINAKNLHVNWGYDLNVIVKNSSIINIGTAENPVASGIVTIEYTIKTVLKETRNSISFLISGIGKTKVY